MTDDEIKAALYRKRNGRKVAFSVQRGGKREALIEEFDRALEAGLQPRLILREPQEIDVTPLARPAKEDGDGA